MPPNRMDDETAPPLEAPSGPRPGPALATGLPPSPETPGSPLSYHNTNPELIWASGEKRSEGTMARDLQTMTAPVVRQYLLTESRLRSHPLAQNLYPLWRYHGHEISS